LIETERLVLRLPRLEDAEALRVLYADAEAMRFIGGVDPELDTVAVIERWLERWNANGFGHFAVELRDDGRFLGRTGFVAWDTRDWRLSTILEAGEHAQTELGWALARESWGNGYATEAALAARAWLRSERSVERLISLIAPDNVRSRRVAEKLGARPEREVTTPHGQATVWVHPQPAR
jgi:RimJ/RimL family protein N-acetyltransferase